MATQTAQQPSTTSTGGPNAPSSTKAGVPFHPASSNYIDAQAAANATPTPPIRIPDGRRNSQGEILPSPTESWKPKMNRVQSWNQEDLKRKAYKEEMVNGKVGQGTGFTEGGEGTRRV